MTKTLVTSAQAIKYYIDQIGISLEELEKVTKVPLEKIQLALKNGAPALRETQLERVADALIVPVEYLQYGHKRYSRDLPQHLDFRKRENDQLGYKDKNIIFKLAELRSAYLNINPKCKPFQLHLSGNLDRDVTLVREYFSIGDYEHIKTPQQFYSYWREAIESKDILIVEQSRYSVGAEALALSYRSVPIVALFTNYQSNARKLFNMLSQVMVLGLGGSGYLTNIFNCNQKIEQYACKVVGELLLPSNLLSTHYNSGLSIEQNIKNLQKVVKCSPLCIALRMLQLGFITQQEYNIYEQESLTRVPKFFKAVTKDVSVLKSYGLTFVRNVILAFWDNKLSEKQTQKMLGLNEKNKLHRSAFAEIQEKVFYMQFNVV